MNNETSLSQVDYFTSLSVHLIYKWVYSLAWVGASFLLLSKHDSQNIEERGLSVT